MENRKYAFELKAKNSVEIYDYASSDEVVTLDDAHIQDFLQWYFDDDGALATLLCFPRVKALGDACAAFVEAWEKAHQLEKTDVALRMAKSALAPFQVPE